MLKFELSIDEANVILAHLGKGKYDEVAGLIAKLQEQAQAQLRKEPESVGVAAE